MFPKEPSGLMEVRWVMGMQGGLCPFPPACFKAALLTVLCLQVLPKTTFDERPPLLSILLLGLISPLASSSRGPHSLFPCQQFHFVHIVDHSRQLHKLFWKQMDINPKRVTLSGMLRRFPGVGSARIHVNKQLLLIMSHSWEFQVNLRVLAGLSEPSKYFLQLPRELVFVDRFAGVSNLLKAPQSRTVFLSNEILCFVFEPIS